MRKYFFSLLACILLFSILCFSQEKNNLIVVKGTVETIAADGSYIIVDGKKILTSKEFIENYYLEPEDAVEVMAENKEEGLTAVDCQYIFTEENIDETPSVKSEDKTTNQ